MPPTNRLSPPSGDQGVGAAMRVAREAGGVGLREMAKRLGYSAHSNLSEYESGKRLPPEDIVAGYQRVLGLTDGSLVEALTTALDGRAATARKPASPIAPDPIAAEPKSQPEGDSSAGTTAQQPRRRRAWLAVLAVVAALVVVAAVIVVVRWQQPGQPAAVPTAVFADGSDPQVTGCRNDAVVVDSVDVYDPPEHLVGTLELRASPHCGMSWGRFSPTEALLVLPPVTLVIAVERPADGAQAPFSVTYDGQPAYGNMLISRQECVYATLVLQRQGQNSSTFKTACVRSPGH
jgi:transcriptional regulator with XRE-family HTH domain